MSTRQRRTSVRRRMRRGFSLTEVIMAMTLLSVVLLSLAKMSFVLSQRSRENDQLAKRNAVLIQQANKFGAMSFASLAGFDDDEKTFTAGDFSYTRQLTITPTGATEVTVKIIIIPTRLPAKKDSVIVYRTRPAGSPLCVGCGT